jgi:erythromycin esterase-like protein
MPTREAGETRSLVRSAARPLGGGPAEYDALLERIGNARLVLLGDACWGIHEFARARVDVTKRLIAEKGFAGVAVDADWPDASRVDRWVRGEAEDDDPAAALAGFRRFPSWPWRNADMRDFVDWLRQRNDTTSDAREKAGFWGLDFYSLNASVEAVLACLRRADPDAARRAEARYACFDRFGGDARGWSAAGTFGHAVPCEDELVDGLSDSSRLLARQAGFAPARRESLITGAASYYRALLGSPVLSWAPRERHMADTLDALGERLSSGGEPAKLVVWAHSAHVGDARATEMGDGEPSFGQLVRSRYGAGAVAIGFTTGSGTVTAASSWDGPARRHHLAAPLAGSYEDLFHAIALPRFFLDLHGDTAAERVLAEPRLERAIGAVYRPETERQSHWFVARLPGQFDAVVHFDRARAIEPLERTALWMRGEPAPVAGGRA